MSNGKHGRPAVRVSRRGFCYGAAAATFLGPLILPSRSARAKEFDGKTIRVLTWSDVTGQAAVKNIVKPFQTNTGATVYADTVGATSEMVAKVKASASNPQFDVVILSGVGAIELAKSGLLDKPDGSKLPNWDSVAENLRSGADGYGIGYYLYTDGMIYNTDTFASPPDSYRIMWDEKHAGKLFLPPPQWTEAMELTVVAARLAGGDEFNPEPGFKLLEELKGRVLALGENPPQITELFRAGSLDVGALHSPQLFLGYMDKPDYKISGTLGAKEGFTYDLQFMVIPKGHPGDAEVIHAFINYAMDPEVQGKMVQDAWYAPTNLNVVIPEEIKHLPWIVDTKTVVDKGIKMDKNHLATVRADWIKRYTEMFSI